MGTYHVLASCMLLYVFRTCNLMQNYYNKIKNEKKNHSNSNISIPMPWFTQLNLTGVATVSKLNRKIWLVSNSWILITSARSSLSIFWRVRDEMAVRRWTRCPLSCLHKHYCLREWQLFTMTDALLPIALNPVFLKMVSVRSNVYAPFWFLNFCLKVVSSFRWFLDNSTFTYVNK